jgi:hypothetical protein
MDEYKRFYARCEKELSRENTLRKPFDTLGIPGCEMVRVENTYTVEPNRYGLNAVFRRDSDNQFLKATVDFKHGRPTWQQTMDVTFGIGESSDLKITVFDGQDSELDDADDSADVDLAQCFVNVLNSCGGTSYLLKMNTPKGGGAKFTPIATPPKDRKLILNELPSRSDFERAEFWVRYHSERFPEPKALTSDPLSWFRDHSLVQSRNVKSETRWDDHGIRLEAVFRTPLETHEFRHRFDTNFVNAWGNYQGCTIRIRTKEGERKRLTAKLSDVPFRNFVLATESERKEFRSFYQLAEPEIPYFIDMVIRETRKRKERTKKDIQKRSKGIGRDTLH